MESTINNTLSPKEQKYSAIVVAIAGANRRIIGLSSPVATTVTTLESFPFIVSSSISRTSRPRSPVNAKTTVSKSSVEVIIANNVDLPTPEPAKIPIRWPKQSGVNISITLTPVRNPLPTRALLRAGTACVSTGIFPGPVATGPKSSMASPNALTTRPFHDLSGETSKGPFANTDALSAGTRVSS